MGTNYYARKPLGDVCTQCNQGVNGYDSIHIGKSSAGWTFTFNPQYGDFKSFDQWVDFIVAEKCLIYDEYNEKIPLLNFIEKVISKQKNKCKSSDNGGFVDEDGYTFTDCSDFC